MHISDDQTTDQINPSDPSVTSLLQRVADVIEVSTIGPAPSPYPEGSFQMEGILHHEPQYAYDLLAKRFDEIGYTPLFKEGKADQSEKPGQVGHIGQTGQHVTLIALQGGFPQEHHSRLWLSILLFCVTVVSTSLIGGLTPTGYHLGYGLSFSAGLLSILFVHEMGHFLMAKRFGVAVSYPFFIPLPLPPIGTMGAFIAMKSPPRNRRQLLGIGIAGPLAGLAVAVPVLLLGLSLSEVITLDPPDPNNPYIMEGNSLAYAGLKYVVFGKFLPDGTHDVMLHPVAWAGWIGLLVTGLNLIPAGQLDGGHVLYALVGARFARIATWVIIVTLVVLGMTLDWQGWFLWAFLIFLLGRRRGSVLNELTTITWWQRVIAIIGLLIFVLVFVPRPLVIVPS
jgi:Zn-dependent protease